MEDNLLEASVNLARKKTFLKKKKGRLRFFSFYAYLELSIA